MLREENIMKILQEAGEAPAMSKAWPGERLA
jgi:hypothetical protein